MQVLTPADLKSDKKVILYGATHCPYCSKAKALLTSLNVEFEYRGTDVSAQFEKEREALGKHLEYETIPMIFVNNQFIGGNSDLHELHEKGGLLPLLK
ncbi:unnamed protein product [Paramecium octaurelia]|uniref:Glutaredoxin domain-containing protein n=1 Tax=Paramecium octaurelia TaxID=43137 RepID=A0A8S1W3Z0_PAROT|nr:unnamed protein product [Paramecium octaurelia]